jgi:hypothetical protein
MPASAPSSAHTLSRPVDRRRADAPCRAEDHHPLPRSQPPGRDQRVVRGQVGDPEAGRLGQRQARRDRRDSAGRDQHLLGHGTGESRAVDQVTGRQPGHPVAHGRHPAGELAARGERQRGGHLVAVGEQEQVRVVHRRRRHVDKHVARGNLRTRDVADDDVLRTAVLFAARRPHASSRSQLADNRITKYIMIPICRQPAREVTAWWTRGTTSPQCFCGVGDAVADAGLGSMLRTIR